MKHLRKSGKARENPITDCETARGPGHVYFNDAHTDTRVDDITMQCKSMKRAKTDAPTCANFRADAAREKCASYQHYWDIAINAYCNMCAGVYAAAASWRVIVDIGERFAKRAAP